MRKQFYSLGLVLILLIPALQADIILSRNMAFGSGIIGDNRDNPYNWPRQSGIGFRLACNP